MSRNNRNLRTVRQEGDAPLPLSSEIAIDPGAGDDRTAEPLELVTPEEALAMTEGDQVDVIGAMQKHGEQMLEEVNATAELRQALTWILESDLARVERWTLALEERPNAMVYDVFGEHELDTTGVDFAGDDLTTATPWVLEQYRKYLAKQEEQDGSDDGEPMEPTVVGVGENKERPLYYAGLRERYKVPAEWVDSEIDEWIAAEGYNLGDAGLTERGSFVLDPTRFASRKASQFPTSELLDAIEGKLSDEYESRLSDLVNIYRQREVTEPAWSFRELVDFLKQGIEPAKVSTGAWRNDVTRNRRHARDWSIQELTGWALGEVWATGVTTDVTAAKELNARLTLGVITPTPEDVKQAYKKSLSPQVQLVGTPPTATTPVEAVVPEEPAPAPKAIAVPQGLTPMNAAYIKTQTERYSKACMPGRPITAEAGAKEQRELDNLFRYILRLEDPVGFANAMAQLRDWFAANRETLFEPTYADRFTGSLRPEGNLQETHINLITTFRVYTDPNKSARKQFDLAEMLSKFPVERQSWLYEFFSRYC